MGTIDRILQLQQDYRAVAGEHNTVKKQWKSLDAQYGGSREQRRARLDELSQELSETLHVEPGEHGAFDAHHNLRVSGTKRTWTAVPECPDCDRNMARYGRNALRKERAQIYSWNKELNGYIERMNSLRARAEAIVADINQQARYVGLPRFEADITGEGFITATDTVQDFSARGQYVLNSGTSVTYGDTIVVLDDAEQVMAYRSRGSDWTVMRVAARPRITRRGWYSILHQNGTTGTIEMMIGTDGESTNSYPHVHVIHDESKNQIRIVASRSSSDHSPPEFLSGDASGNEVNAAIERAIRLL